MREIRYHVTDIDRHLEEVLRTKQQFPTITSPIFRLASIPSRLSAALRPRAAGLTALTGSRSSPVRPLRDGRGVVRTFRGTSAQERMRELVLQAYAEYEDEKASEAAS